MKCYVEKNEVGLDILTCKHSCHLMLCVLYSIIQSNMIKRCKVTKTDTQGG